MVAILQASPSSIERTTSYPFKLEVQSSGLQLLVRYCQAPSQSLGWTPPSMPSNLQLGTQPLTALRHLAPETTSRAVIVVRGIQGDSEIVAKNSQTNPKEVGAHPRAPFSPDGQSGRAMAWLVIYFIMSPVRPWLDVRVACMGIEVFEMVQGDA